MMKKLIKPFVLGSALLLGLSVPFNLRRMQQVKLIITLSKVELSMRMEIIMAVMNIV